MSDTKTIEYIGVKARIHQHDGLIHCPYLPPLNLYTGYVPLLTTSGEVIERSPIKFVTRYDIQVTLEPINAPSHPDIGDVYAEEVGDEIFFYVWDGDTWVEAYGQRDETEEVEETDTPEKAYERAMRVLK